MVIRPEPLTTEAFRPFGEVIEWAGSDVQIINEGNTEKFADLASLTPGDKGSLALSIYRSNAVKSPVSIRGMECHPLASQAFIPLHPRPFPVVVAVAGAPPGAAGIRLFLTNGRQGVNLFPGTWHHYQLSLGEDSEYVVIDRKENGGNLETYTLPEPVVLHI